MGPLTAHELAMPAQDGLGADHQDSTPPQAARLGRGRFERRGQTDQEDFVRVADAWRACRPLERLQLVAQEQDLEILGALRTAAQDEALQDEGDDPDEQAVHGVGTSGPTDRVPRAYHPQIHLAGTLCAVFALYGTPKEALASAEYGGAERLAGLLSFLGRGGWQTRRPIAATAAASLPSPPRPESCRGHPTSLSSEWRKAAP